jgi:hypothetical protein
MPTKRVLLSRVKSTPVISDPRTPTKKGSRVCASAGLPHEREAPADVRFGAVAHLSRNRSEHHAVGHVRVGAVVRLDPEHPAAIEPQPIRAREIVGGVETRSRYE